MDICAFMGHKTWKITCPMPFMSEVIQKAQWLQRTLNHIKYEIAGDILCVISNSKPIYSDIIGNYVRISSEPNWLYMTKQCSSEIHFASLINNVQLICDDICYYMYPYLIFIMSLYGLSCVIFIVCVFGKKSDACFISNICLAYVHHIM